MLSHETATLKSRPCKNLCPNEWLADNATNTYFEDIALDPDNMMLYLTSKTEGSLMRVEAKEGSQLEVFLTRKGSRPTGIAIDPCSRSLDFSEEYVENLHQTRSCMFLDSHRYNLWRAGEFSGQTRRATHRQSFPALPPLQTAPGSSLPTFPSCFISQLPNSKFHILSLSQKEVFTFTASVSPELFSQSEKICKLNIATGKTSQAITPFHFLDYSNFSNFYHKATFSQAITFSQEIIFSQEINFLTR